MKIFAEVFFEILGSGHMDAVKGRFPQGGIFHAELNFLCLKTNWWRVGVKRLDKRSYCSARKIPPGGKQP